MLAKNELRILAGKYKGAKLASPGIDGTHPMGAREKLALFNMLQPYLAGAHVLDAYAGSGALGFEALSRGASAVDFVENEIAAVRCIKQNLQTLASRAPEHIEANVWKTRIEDYTARRAYDLVLADPPYLAYPVEVLATLAPLLQPGGVLALSYPAKEGAPTMAGLEILADRHYAAAGIAIYRKNC